MTTEAALEDWKKVLGGRFEVRRSALLGHGAYAVVRRGRDLQSKRLVAVKTYREGMDDGGCGRVTAEMVRALRREVEVLQALHQMTPDETCKRLCQQETPCGAGRKVGPGQSFTALPEEPSTEDLLRGVRLDPRELFVELYGYSCGADAAPGAEDGMCYIVQEFGLETLESYVADAKEFGKPLSPLVVRGILLQLTRVVAALHAHSLVHMDIKPSNIMRFKRGRQSVWKLIDMDGLQTTRSSVDPLQVPFTPMYCPPEIARAVAGNEPRITVSRWMDVWSVGVTILDCILPDSLLSAEYQRGQGAFLEWLGSITQLELPDQVAAFDGGLAELLRTQVLQPEPRHRASILDIFGALRGAPKPEPAAASPGQPSAAAGVQRPIPEDSQGSVQLNPMARQAKPKEQPPAPSPRPGKPNLASAGEPKQKYMQQVLPILVPLVRHLINFEAEDVEASALSFLEAQLSCETHGEATDGGSA